MATGGRYEIRTHEELAPLPVFKTGAFNRSANLPFSSTSRQAAILALAPICLGTKQEEDYLPRPVRQSIQKEVRGAAAVPRVAPEPSVSTRSWRMAVPTAVGAVS